MELEQVLPEITKQADGQELLKVCRRFANVLTDKTWNQPTVRSTKIQREFISMLTIPDMNGDADDEAKKERQVAVAVDFTAEKEQIGLDEDTQLPELQEVYTISASVREVMALEELPQWILDKARETIILRDTDDSTKTLAAADLGLEVLGAFTFEKVVEVEYVVDEEGELDDYTVACRYLCDEWLLDQVDYSWSGAMIEFESTVVEDEAQETRRSNSEPISEEEIQEFQESFDVIIQSLNEAEEFNQFEADDSEEGFYMTEEMHCRRALGMIALNSRRFVGMTIK